MLKNILNKLLGKQNNSGESVIVRLNDKVMPIDRGEVYEDPLDELLRINKYGEVTGGGTMQAKTGEIEFCDLEVLIYKNQNLESVTAEIIKLLESHGAPKGSFLTIDKSSEVIPFGKAEGLAIYLDGVNLPENVYKECDSTEVLLKLGTLMGDSGNILRYWQGETETALYFYGESFEKMKHAIAEFIKEYPLCQGARVIQIA